MFTPSKPKVVITMLFRKWRTQRAEKKERELLFTRLLARFTSKYFPLMEKHSRSTLQKQFPVVTFEDGQKVQFFQPEVLQALRLRDGTTHGGIFFTIDEKQTLVCAYTIGDDLYRFQPLTHDKLDLVSLSEVLIHLTSEIARLEEFEAWAARALRAAPKRLPHWMRVDRFDNSYKGIAMRNR